MSFPLLSWTPETHTVHWKERTYFSCNGCCLVQVSTLLTSIQSLLTDPNTSSPANPEAAQLYNTDRPAYNKKVRWKIFGLLSCSLCFSLSWRGYTYVRVALQGISLKSPSFQQFSLMACVNGKAFPLPFHRWYPANRKERHVGRKRCKRR